MLCCRPSSIAAVVVIGRWDEELDAIDCCGFIIAPTTAAAPPVVIFSFIKPVFAFVPKFVTLLQPLC